LRQTWPAFLGLLERDPKHCFAGFYIFARKLLTVCPPRALRMVPHQQRDDIIHDIILHCCQDDFRVLRRYQDHGKPFAAWFLLVARNKIVDQLRTERLGTPVSLAEEDEESPGIILQDSAPTADLQTDRRKILAFVQDVLLQMSDKCRILIQGAAEGRKPREMTRLLGWPTDWNKKVSDDLRECRQRLRTLLDRSGMDIEELKEHFRDG
ncbi:MAG: sigma-70 family RNA polymerase sigma factor, partial [bacterium]